MNSPNLIAQDAAFADRFLLLLASVLVVAVLFNLATRWVNCRLRATRRGDAQWRVR